MRWEIQLDTLPIPKSATPSRQQSNIDVFDFELTADEMLKMNGLTQVDGRLFNADPATHEEK